MNLFAKCLLTVSIFLCCLPSIAQQPGIGFNSAEVIKKGIEFYKQKDYKKAIAEYLKVPRNDTNYVTVLHDLSLFYYADSNYAESRNAAAKGLQFYPEKADDWYNLMANSSDKMGDHEQAIALV